MKGNILRIGLAGLMAVGGAGALVAYVASAERRALADQELVEVLVVQDNVSAGTLGSELQEHVTTELVPALIRPAAAVISLDDVRTEVAAVDLVPGELLLSTRFVSRADFSNREVGVDVPKDHIEVTIALDPERGVGGLIEPGETVAVFASFDPFDLTSTVVEIDGSEVALPDSVSSGIDARTPNSTEIILQKVLVTAIQLEPSAGFDDKSRDPLTETVNGKLYITLALRPADAEKIVFAAEFGYLWLASERAGVPLTNDPIQTRSNIYETIGDES